MQATIQELRNAELKRAESREQAEVKVEFIPGTADLRPVRMDAAALTASQFSIVVSTKWRFAGGGLDGQPVLPLQSCNW